MVWGCYLVLINVMTYALFGEDKKRAKEKKRRIPERTLLLLAFFGGAVGAFIGMQKFRHKTRKPKFRIGVPMILVAQIVLTVFIITNLL